MKALRAIGLALVVVAAALGIIAFAARFADGPVGPFPGGSLEAGAWLDEATEPDGSELAAVESIEFQLLEPPRSRTTWILVHDGALYIPCGIPRFRVWKRWPHEALADGRAVIRVGDRKLRRLAVREEDPEIIRALVAKLEQKYGVDVGDGPPGDSVWYFRLDPRPAPSAAR
ncbi:MAG: hypothetical protein ACQGVK_21695 [Myxococcota bacterium]